MDAATIANHRGCMFLEMGAISNEQSEELIRLAEPWIAKLQANGEYQGWFIEEQGQVVAGGGLHLWEMGPQPGCLKVGRWAHIANVYTLPHHRRRGLARRLTEEMLRWSYAEGIDQITLSASDDGRHLYESLGFSKTDWMKRTPV